MIRTTTAWRSRLLEKAAVWAEAAVVADQQAGRTPKAWKPSVIASRTVSSEVATLLHVPERTAQNMVENAKTLVRNLPATMAALTAGSVSYDGVKRIVDQSYTLPAEALPAYDEALAAVAPELTPSQIETRARRLRERLHPESISERRRAENENRRVDLEPEADGMAYLGAYLPVEKAAAIHSRLTDIAYDLRRTHPDDPRTLSQLRADAFADLLIDGGVVDGPWNPGIRARVIVSVPVLTLLGVEELPATLNGVIPIAPEVARELTANAPSMMRVLTHPETSAVLSVGRDSYSVPADLKAWLRVRDGTCRSPGCTVPAHRCDIDHTVDWQYLGETEHDNLAHMCRGHHNLKHHTGWRVKQLGGGVLEWTSPTGRVSRTYPEVDLG